MSKFKELFPISKPIIGMIHLAGDSRRVKINRAKNELKIYEEEGVDGTIFEDYYGTPQDVSDALTECMFLNDKVILGANILKNPYEAFEFTRSTYPLWKGTRFVQFDSVQETDLDVELYNHMRKNFPCVVLGGIRFKYTESTGKTLEEDLKFGMSLCDAIVTTGGGTGKETPIGKLKKFKKIMGDFPLIVGAGLNPKNAYKQLQIADGGIVGSCFKPDGDTTKPVDEYLVREFMDVVKKAREGFG